MIEKIDIVIARKTYYITEDTELTAPGYYFKRGAGKGRWLICNDSGQAIALAVVK